MARELIGFFLISLVFAIAFRIYRSVAARRERQEKELPAPDSSQGGLELGDVLYVATVYAARPLDRIWAYGLGSRGRAKLFASDSGLSLERRGEPDVFIPVSSIRGITKERATIDKGVEKDGLVAIHWQLGGQQVATHLRIVSNQKQILKQIQEVTGDNLD